jgi:hypothetical protein
VVQGVERLGPVEAVRPRPSARFVHDGRLLGQSLVQLTCIGQKHGQRTSDKSAGVAVPEAELLGAEDMLEEVDERCRETVAMRVEAVVLARDERGAMRPMARRRGDMGVEQRRAVQG